MIKTCCIKGSVWMKRSPLASEQCHVRSLVVYLAVSKCNTSHDLSGHPNDGSDRDFLFLTLLEFSIYRSFLLLLFFSNEQSSDVICRSYFIPIYLLWSTWFSNSSNGLLESSHVFILREGSQQLLGDLNKETRNFVLELFVRLGHDAKIQGHIRLSAPIFSSFFDFLPLRWVLLVAAMKIRDYFWPFL